jgi:membrane fusion protein, multidrug efflux system
VVPLAKISQQEYATNFKALEATLQADREAISNAQDVVRSDRIAITNNAEY